MSAVSFTEGLLSREDTLRLLSYLNHEGICLVDKILNHFSTHRPGRLGRVRNSIKLLTELKLLIVDEQGIRLNATLPADPEDRACLIADHIFTVLMDRLYNNSAQNCLQYDPKSNQLWLDSFQAPGCSGGLSFWLLEFGLTHRTAITDRLWLVDGARQQELLDAVYEASLRHLENGVSIEKLKERIARQEDAGREAEDWVVSFEQRRLADHPRVDAIRRISDDSSGAGFDIISFFDEASLRHDRFIEVKSYRGEKRFFWTRNEMGEAKRLGESYVLFIVDRNQMESPNYTPEIIPGPHGALVESEGRWSISPHTYECFEKL